MGWAAGRVEIGPVSFLLGRGVVQAAVRYSLMRPARSSFDRVTGPDRGDDGDVVDGRSLVDPSVRSVLVVVVDVLVKERTELAFVPDDRAIEEFVTKCANPSLGVGVRVGRALGDQHHADARVPEPTPDIMAPFPIPIADQDLP